LNLQWSDGWKALLLFSPAKSSFNEFVRIIFLGLI